MSLIAAILPLALLIVSMTVSAPRVRLPMAAEHALPLAACVAYGIVVSPFGPPEAGVGAPSPLSAIHARVVEGLLTSLTPLAIVFGAILLFSTLQRSGAMAVLTHQLRRLSPDPVAQVLLVGWSFSYLVEGLSGFGTPAALAAPILVGLGFPAIRVAAACLIMNTVPVAFGAVGTPIWFGLGELALSDEQLLRVGQRAAMVQVVAAPPVVLLALRMLFPWAELRARLPLILGTVAATVAGSFAVARSSVEFPSIAGGLCGFTAALLLSRWSRLTGGHRDDRPQRPAESDARSERLSPRRAAIPLVLTVLLLAVTRIDALGLKALLTSERGGLRLDLGTVGELSLSPAGVVRLREILQTDIGWSMPLLFVPFLIPFVLVAGMSIPLLRMDRAAVRSAWSETASRLTRPAAALAGALVLVKLLMHGGEGAAVMVIGGRLAQLVGDFHAGLWPPVAPLLGALGSFFSGSATVSNLTFGPVQHAIAERLGLDPIRVLAMQTAGAAMGNMVCIHNIVAVAAVLGVRRAAADEGATSAADPSGSILRLTIGPMLVYALCAALVAV